MNMQQMTEKVQEAFMQAQSLAVEKQHQEVDVEHVCVALLQQEDGLARRIYEKMSVPVSRLLDEWNKQLNKKPQV
ncbi:MAG: hypothetical protein N3A70_05560, partial [Anoxybacillus gonensis]|nr:hypothetical protein [Anoxybacillus gonensis]